MKQIFKILISLFIFDFLISSLFLKETNLWENNNWDNKFWRIESNIYHHDLMPNIDVVESWGGTFTKRIVTNSLGFRDFTNKDIQKKTNKKRILLVGDSFIEGTGYDYEFTIGGLLQNELGDNYEILNSAVGSYSPSIYYKKINHFLSEGYKFDQALVFLDVSDIFDELFIEFDSLGKIITEKKIKEKNYLKIKFYSLGGFLRDNTIVFRSLYLISDKTEIYKNYFKLKYKSSKFLNKSFFKTSKDDVLFYRMTHIDRGYWTYSDEKYDYIKKGLEQSDFYLKKLFDLFKAKSIDSHLIIYPWPSQIEFGDGKHDEYWTNFAQRNNIKFLNTYDQFKSNDTRNFIFDNFIYGDIHWNKKGTNLIFNEVIKKINF